MSDSLAAAEGVMGEVLRRVDQELVEGNNGSCEANTINKVCDFRG